MLAQYTPHYDPGLSSGGPTDIMAVVVTLLVLGFGALIWYSYARK